MKLSSRARYALRSMIQIGRLSNNGAPVSLADISKKTSISRRYLEQLAISLKNSQLLRGISGKGGGYVLARPPEDIKIGDIIEAAIGPINIVDCVKQPETCLKTDVCECRLVYVLINNRITEVLNEFSLADLMDKGYLEKLSREIMESEIGLPDGPADQKRVKGRVCSPCTTMWDGGDRNHS